MKGLCLSAVLWLLAGTASATVNDVACDWTNQKSTFTYFNHRALYSCDYVEKQALWILETLGAQNVDLTCRGGLPYEDTVYLTARFESLKPSANGSVKAAPRRATLEITESCDLNERLVKKLSKNFTILNKDVKGMCRDSRGRQTYNFTVLR